jgi:nicotinamidase-related amidase
VKLKLCLSLLAAALTACDRATSGPRIGVYDHPQVGLVVVDAQPDFLPAAAEPMLAAANQLIQGAPGLGVAVVYVRSEPGAPLDPRLGGTRQPVFFKRRSDAFSNPDLDEYFRGHEIDHLVLAGARVDSSVYYTALGAMNRGYKVKVVSDAVATSSAARRDGALDALQQRGVEIIATERMLAEWARKLKYLGSR